MEWRDVKGYEGLYKVSDCGEIMSYNFYRSKSPKILSQTFNTSGYLGVTLSKNNIARRFLVHRIVAEAFIPNENNLEMVNHKDEDKTNNHVENLEWCTRSYNQLYSMKLHPERNAEFGSRFRNKITGESTSPFTRKGVAHTRLYAIEQRNLQGDLIKVYNNSTEAGRENDIDIGNIFDCCMRNARTDRIRNRKRKASCKGFIWEFNDKSLKCVLGKNGLQEFQKDLLQ
jgi:hypothetical protein